MPTRIREARGCAGLLLAGAAILLLGCDSSPGGTGSSAGAPGSGGVAGTGGAASGGSLAATGGTSIAGGSSHGGVTTTGGAVASGGVVASGGASGGTVATAATTTTGGAETSGGSIASGGVAASGGASGGTVVTGGRPVAGTTATGGATAGTIASGGTTGAGGSKSTGGTSMGGVPSTGGGKITGGTSAAGGATGSTGPLSALTIYIAGDSTVSTYVDTAATNDWAGWGQMLHEVFNDKVTVDNRAEGGRTAYWFYLEGSLDKILSTIKPGDYFFIQFGTNDSNQAASFTVNGTTYPRYAPAETTFKTQLKQYYLDPTKAKGAIPVLVTPPPRNSAYCNGANGLGAYDTAMIELGTAENVAVVDLGGMTFNYLKAICPKPTTAAAETFFKNNTGTIDGTHFQENGARKMAGFIGEAIRTLNLPLAAYLL